MGFKKLRKVLPREATTHEEQQTPKLAKSSFIFPCSMQKMQSLRVVKGSGFQGSQFLILSS